MIRQFSIKNVVAAIVFVIIFGAPETNARVLLLPEKTTPLATKKSISEDLVIKNAWQKIQKTISEEETSRSRSPKKIYVEYKFAGNDLILENKKIYFSGYRAEPKYNSKIIINDDSINPDKIIKVVYKKNDDKISIVEHNLLNGEKNTDTKEVTIHSLLA